MIKINSDIFLTLTECSKEIGISRQNLTRILQEGKYLYKITGQGNFWYIKKQDWENFKENRIRRQG